MTYGAGAETRSVSNTDTETARTRTTRRDILKYGAAAGLATGFGTMAGLARA